MRGYYPRPHGRPQRGRRGAALRLAHRPWLGGTIEAAVGNVFGEHLQGFRPGRLRFSGDIGISTRSA